MRLGWLVFVLAAGAWLGAACSGKTDSSTATVAGAGGSSLGGSGGQAGSCPSDLQLVAGGSSCLAVLDTCQTGLCIHAEGTWACSSACPCPADWQCVSFPGQSPGCAPASIAACLTPGTAGAAGAGGAGGAGGWAGNSGAGGLNVGGSAGWGGTSGWGGAGGVGGGTGGTGPCGGHPACPANVAALFCDATWLLECAVNDKCPKPKDCAQFCAGCICHVAPPINGALNAGCDTCMTDNDCTGGLSCLEDPMLKGSGAKACVMK